MLNILIFILVGLAAGILSGMFGIGGGIIIIPVLIYLCGFSQLKAQGTSLAILLPPVGILAFMQYYREDNVDIKAGLLICLFLIVGSSFGAKIAHTLPIWTLKKGFSVLLFAMALKMFFSK